MKNKSLIIVIEEGEDGGGIGKGRRYDVVIKM